MLETAKLVEFARTTYPKPIRKSALTSTSSKDASYCVGGALMLAARDLALIHEDTVIVSGYPSKDSLVAFLKSMNPSLSEVAACEFAGGVLGFNIGDEEESSWKSAAAALDC